MNADGIMAGGLTDERAGEMASEPAGGRPVLGDLSEPLEEPDPSKQGFEEIYVASYERMVRLARLTSAGTVPAEEIVQDAFIQLYRSWDSVQSPIGYLRVAVMNGCRSWGRRRLLALRRRPPPEPLVALDDDSLAVRESLQVLSPRQRAAVVLRYFEDLPEAEIARLLGCRPGTVKSLLARSMPKLKGALNDE